MVYGEMILSDNFRKKEMDIMQKRINALIYISTYNLRGLTHRVWRRQNFREVTFEKVKY